MIMKWKLELKMSMRIMVEMEMRMRIERRMGIHMTLTTRMTHCPGMILFFLELIKYKDKYSGEKAWRFSWRVRVIEISEGKIHF